MIDFSQRALGIISMQGTEEFAEKVNSHINALRHDDADYIIKPEMVRFASGEAKCILHDSMRERDIYILADMFYHSEEEGHGFKMYGKEYPLCPDILFSDLKRIIGAIAGKADRISVIMPMLYESRQDKRSRRESLDGAMALQELVNMGVNNFLTLDVHNPAIQNAIPFSGFDNVRPTFQMIQTLLEAYDDIHIDKEHLVVISPDEGGMKRAIYFSKALGVDIGMFYKERDYNVVENGKNKVVAHEYLGGDLRGKDCIVVDDMIASGGSMIEVAEQLKDKGAGRVFLFASFGLFTEGPGSFDRAFEAKKFDRVFTTNSIYRTPEILSRPWYCEVNVANYIGALIDALNSHNTISGLLNPKERIESLLNEYKERQARVARYESKNN